MVAPLVLAGVAANAEAQQRRPPGPPPPLPTITLGISGGWTRDAAEAFADPICPDTDASSFAGHAGFRVLGPFLAQALVTYHRGQEEGCANGLLPPPPDVGPFTREYASFDDRYRGYPFFTSAARAGVELPVGRRLRVRGLGGMGVIWEKDVPFRSLAVELLLGRGGRSLFAQAERWWHEVPRRVVTEQFVDGDLVAFEVRMEDVGYRTTLLRLGMEFALSR